MSRTIRRAARTQHRAPARQRRTRTGKVHLLPRPAATRVAGLLHRQRGPRASRQGGKATHRDGAAEPGRVRPHTREETPAPEEPHAALRPQPAQGVPAAQPGPAAHRLLHRHVQLARTAFRPFGKPPLHLRARGASHRQHGYRPCANLRPTEDGIGKRGTVLVQPRGRERPAVAQCSFLPHLPGRGGITPLLLCGSAGGEGTPTFAARNIRTVAAAGTRNDGRRDAAQAGSSPRSRRSTEDTHALRKPVPGGGKMTGVGKRYGWGGYLGV